MKDRDSRCPFTKGELKNLEGPVNCTSRGRWVTISNGRCTVFSCDNNRNRSGRKLVVKC